ncbi:SAM hydrolase/SAM-dependent halogenase family protein [Ekhidna sp. To15]|uniref:SAM hydrolase/SAM-dependent halogenase family protein n=1 Tax=Ekhidna sp. To15 TaxID=3395267 RepID=UPI003F523888
MALITFMSDFGTVDHYVAAVKAAIVSELPAQPITDITHDIRPFDISHAANVLRNVYKDFPAKTVHIVAVDAMREKSKALAIELDGHLFVGFDSGIFSLVSEKKPDQIVVLENGLSTFPAKDVLAKTALQLANGKSLKDVGTLIGEMTELYARQLKVTKREIAGHVVTVDRYGNLITNIKKSEFEKILEINGTSVKYLVRFGREVFPQLNTYFSDVESGDCYVLFNSSDQLQIGINKGNASELLGLSVDSPVLIEFTTE